MIKFVKYYFSASNKVSSKRVGGTAGLICALIMMFTGIQHPAIDTLLIGSFALLGVSVFRKEPDPYAYYENPNQISSEP